MSNSIDYIKAFIYVIETYPKLFSLKDTNEVENLIKRLPSNLEQISNKIIAWCETNSEIDDVFIKALPSGERVLGDEVPKAPQHYILLLENAVRENLELSSWHSQNNSTSSKKDRSNEPPKN